MASYILLIKQVGLEAMLYTCILEVLGLNLGTRSPCPFPSHPPSSTSRENKRNIQVHRPVSSIDHATTAI
jgi:hypothetical protein